METYRRGGDFSRLLDSSHCPRFIGDGEGDGGVAHGAGAESVAVEFQFPDLGQGGGLMPGAPVKMP
jgi:hypothetical protein